MPWLFLSVMLIGGLAGFSDTTELRHERIGSGLPEPCCGEDTGLEAADRMNRREQVPTHLQIVDSDAICSRELQDLSLSSDVRRTQR